MTIKSFKSRKEVAEELKKHDTKPPGFFIYTTSLYQNELYMSIEDESRLKLMDRILKNKTWKPHPLGIQEMIHHSSCVYIDVGVKKGEQGFETFEIDEVISFVCKYIQQNLAEDGQEIKAWVTQCVREDKKSYHIHIPIHTTMLALRGIVEELSKTYQCIDKQVVPHPERIGMLRAIYAPKITKTKLAKGAVPYMINGNKSNIDNMMNELADVKITKPFKKELKKPMKNKYYFFCNSPKLYIVSTTKMKLLERAVKRNDLVTRDRG